MALKDKLQLVGTPLSNLNGGTASVPNFALSKLHFESSINDQPTLSPGPNFTPLSPSILDLDGRVPGYNYRSNTPEGRTF
jgi:hypothetical protein